MRNNNKTIVARSYNSFVHAIKNIVEGIKYGISGNTQPKAMQPVKLYAYQVVDNKRNL